MPTSNYAHCFGTQEGDIDRALILTGSSSTDKRPSKIFKLGGTILHHGSPSNNIDHVYDKFSMWYLKIRAFNMLEQQNYSRGGPHGYAARSHLMV